MVENAAYWVWLQQSLGYANSKIRTVLKFYTNIEDFYTGGEREWILCGCFSRAEISALESNTIEAAEEILKKCENLGYKVITIVDDDYPLLLKEIYNPPAVLYVNGDISILKNKLSIAMVGTRNSTPTGVQTAFTISAELASNDIVVVSGGAMGIDSASHKGALQVGGKTICVLGCGINYNYLLRNAEMRRQAAENGAVVSEYPPDTPPTRYSFPQRNRIISGISHGTVIVEAGEKSGSLITANLALEQNRDVFAVPGNITNATSFGTNKLIKFGAIPVTDTNDILEQYDGYGVDRSESTRENIGAYKDVINDIPVKKNIAQQPEVDSINKPNEIKNAKPKLSVDLSDCSNGADTVYNIIKDTPVSIDDMVNKTNFSVSKVMQLLTELEILQYIERKSGGVYDVI